MLLHIPDVLTADQVAHARRRLDEADWVDGRVTAGHQSARVKHNVQLPEDHPVALELGDLILEALQRNALFVSAALPLRVFPPLFNRYEGGHSFGSHVDNAIRQMSGNASPHPHRSVGHAVLQRARRVRRRRASGRGHLRRALASSCRRGTWCSTRRRACITCCR